MFLWSYYTLDPHINYWLPPARCQLIIWSHLHRTSGHRHQAAFLWLTKCPMKIWQGAFWHNLADVLIKFFITFPFPALKGKTICTRKLLLFSFAVYFQILKQMQGYIEEAFDETLQTKTFVASKQDQEKLTTNKSVLSPMVIWLLVNRD